MTSSVVSVGSASVDNGSVVFAVLIVGEVGEEDADEVVTAALLDVVVVAFTATAADVPGNVPEGTLYALAMGVLGFDGSSSSW